MLKFVLSLAVSIVFLGSIALGQSGLDSLGITSTLALGDVTSTSAGKIVLQTKDGEISAILGSATEYKRLPPDNLKLSAAKPAAFTDLAVGDRVLVLGKVSADKKTITASRVFIVKGDDLDNLARKQQREWRMRGIAGKVTAINKQQNSFTVKISSITGTATNLEIKPKEDVKYLKYAATSVRYSDALPSKFDDVEVGDSVQALGDRSEDGTSFAAEEILSGGFVTVAGTVKSIDVEKNEIVITHFNTKKDVTIKVNSNSSLKKFPDEMASRIARLLQFAKSGAGGGGQGGGRRGGAGGRRGMGDINSIANRIPEIKISDLKKGDQIAASSPKSSDESNYTAIKLIAGIGPFIAAQSSSGKKRGVGGSLQVPGLDSVEF